MTMPVQHQSASVLLNKHIKATELSRSHSDSGRTQQMMSRRAEIYVNRTRAVGEEHRPASDTTPVTDKSSARYCFIQQNNNAQYFSPEPGFMDVQTSRHHCRAALKPSSSCHKSMPRLPQSFGTYGTNDIDPDEVFDSVSSRGGLCHGRSMSQGNLIDDIPQQQINACLTESLAGYVL